MIIQYVRNKQREKIGVIVAIPIFGKDSFSIGWSKCNMKLDKFDWRQGRRMNRWGVELALTRALEETSIVKDVRKCSDVEKMDFILKGMTFSRAVEEFSFNFIPLIPQSCEAVCQKVINRACKVYGNHCEQISKAASLGYDKLEILTDCGVNHE